MLPMMRSGQHLTGLRDLKNLAFESCILREGESRFQMSTMTGPAAGTYQPNLSSSTMEQGSLPAELSQKRTSSTSPDHPPKPGVCGPRGLIRGQGVLSRLLH